MDPFEIIEPHDGESPVVVEVPHAGLALDAEALAFTRAPARSIARDADLYMDRICEGVPLEGATLLFANVSRFVVDLNRGPEDFDREAVEGGGRTPYPRGLVWRLTTDGDAILAAPLPRAELERRMEAVYRPYHRAIEGLLHRKLARFGRAVLLCAHSMPSQPRGPAGATALVPRADVVPGTRARTSAASVLIDRVDELAAACGMSVRHDDPYRGGFTTAHYGRPAHGVHAIQIEIARRLYMDETSHRLDVVGLRVVRDFVCSLARALATPLDGDVLVGRVAGSAVDGPPPLREPAPSARDAARSSR